LEASKRLRAARPKRLCEMQSPFSQYQAHRIMRPTRSTWKSRVEGKASGTISANAQPAFLPVTDQRTRHRYEATRCSSAKAIATTRSQPTHFLETTAERIAGIGVKSGQFEDPKPGCYSCMVSASQDPSGLLVTDASNFFLGQIRQNSQFGKERPSYLLRITSSDE
jgi:hypothetical protein